jgi:type IV pilus assembly protein PilA
MALVSCPDCGTQVSDQAPACPKCARPLHAQQPPQSQQQPQMQMQMQHQPQHGWQPPRPQAPKNGLSTGIIIMIVLAVLVVPIVGIVAVMGIYGTRKYVANAKTAEAKNSLGQIAKDAASAYEREELSTDGTVKRRICPSASARVPADPSMVRGRKYQSTAAEWQADLAADAGFACLKFEMSSPQYFQYEYEATPTGFTARAFGDLNGDGVRSTFEIKGQLVDGRVVVSPTILEIDPEE